MTTLSLADAPTATRTKVTYLLGAGATHACAKHFKSANGLLMSDLQDRLVPRVRELAEEPEFQVPTILNLAQSFIGEETDFEHVITFLAQSRSHPHREFAARLRNIFETILRRSLREVEDELKSNRSRLYAALVDMHSVDQCPEQLVGFLTLNYDSFLEHAIEYHLSRQVDYGIRVDRVPGAREDDSEAGPPVAVLKLHGSFDWEDQWPIARGNDAARRAIWIPPGIRKVKELYPFNSVWGRGYELLDCDVLRIIGCNLSANDWDLISMLFTARHTHTSAQPFSVEVIAGPDTVERVKRDHPYLEPRSMLELHDIGPDVVGEHLDGRPRAFAELEPREAKLVTDAVGSKVTNAFSYWLRMKAEHLNSEVESISTLTGAFEEFLEGQ